MTWGHEEAEAWLDSKDIMHTRLGLERIQALVERMGINPASTVHVAGTNGKGSISAFTASMLLAGGYKTGLYTSPHILSVNERLASGQGCIDSETFAEGMGVVKEADDGLECTYFEALTALFFWWQKHANFEHTVIETGMGGRLDATNITLPRVSVITPISLEHTQYLGSTIEAIAAEKAAIIKEGRPAVLARMDTKASKILEDRCQQMLSPIMKSDRGVDVRPVSPMEKRNGRWGQVAEIVTTMGEYGEVFIPLLGAHQRTNAVTAIRTVEVLRRQGLDITDQQIRQGINDVRWPGRIEMLDGPKPIIFDVTHNPGGARVLANELMRLMTAMELDTIVLVLGIMSDKDVDSVLRELTRLRGCIICTTPKTHRAVPSKELAAKAREIGGMGIDIMDVPSVAEAIEKAKFMGDIICVTGSFYTVGEGMEALGVKPSILRG